MRTWDELWTFVFMEEKLLIITELWPMTNRFFLRGSATRRLKVLIFYCVLSPFEGI